MAYQTYLVFNNEELPLPDSYDLSLSSIEADSSGTTEAGTVAVNSTDFVPINSSPL